MFLKHSFCDVCVLILLLRVTTITRPGTFAVQAQSVLGVRGEVTVHAQSVLGQRGYWWLPTATMI